METLKTTAPAGTTPMYHWTLHNHYYQLAVISLRGFIVNEFSILHNNQRSVGIFRLLEKHFETLTTHTKMQISEHVLRPNTVPGCLFLLCGPFNRGRTNRGVEKRRRRREGGRGD